MPTLTQNMSVALLSNDSDGSAKIFPSFEWHFRLLDRPVFTAKPLDLYSVRVTTDEDLVCLLSDGSLHNPSIIKTLVTFDS